MIIDQPFQYRQLRSQSLSPYNDRNVINQLRKQLQQPPTKMMQQSSFEYVYPPEQQLQENNVISQDSIQQYCKSVKHPKYSMILQKEVEPVSNSVHSSDATQAKLVVPKLIVVKKRNLNRKRKKQINPINPQDCNIDDSIQQSTIQQTTINASTIDNIAQPNRSILPQIKKQKLQIEELPIKRSARYEQLMKKSCVDQLNELQSLIKKMQKSPPINKKEKKVTFLI